MNWVEERLDKIQNIPNTNAVPTEEFFIKLVGKPKYSHLTKIIKLAKEYDSWLIDTMKMPVLTTDDFKKQLSIKAKYYTNEVSKIKTKNPTTINRLIEYALGLNLTNNYKDSVYKTARKYGIKILSLLYRANPTTFLNNFVDF